MGITASRKRVATFCRFPGVWRILMDYQQKVSREQYHNIFISKKPTIFFPTDIFSVPGYHK